MSKLTSTTTFQVTFNVNINTYEKYWFNAKNEKVYFTHAQLYEKAIVAYKAKIYPNLALLSEFGFEVLHCGEPKLKPISGEYIEGKELSKMKKFLMRLKNKFKFKK